MAKRIRNKERRNSRRFQVAWDVLVNGTDQDGGRLNEAGTLRNLSSGGAFFCLPKDVNLGAELELQIKVPFRKKNCMKYSAEVVRLEKTSAEVGIAVKFDTARPIFIEQ